MKRLISLLVLLAMTGALLIPQISSAQTQAQRHRTKNEALELAQRRLADLKNNESTAPNWDTAALFQHLAEAGVKLQSLGVTFNQVESYRSQNNIRLAREAYQKLVTKDDWDALYPGDYFHSMRCNLASAHATLADIPVTEVKLAYVRRLAHAKKAQTLWCDYQKDHSPNTLGLYRREVKDSKGDFGPDSECDSTSNFSNATWVPWIVADEQLLCPFTQTRDPLLGTNEQPALPEVYQAALQGLPSAPCPVKPLIADDYVESWSKEGGSNFEIFFDVGPLRGPTRPVSTVRDCPTTPATKKP